MLDTHSTPLRSTRSRALPLVLLALVVVAGLVPGAAGAAPRLDPATRAPSCVGASALVAPEGACPRAVTGTLTPTPAQAPKDSPDLYRVRRDGGTCLSHPKPGFPTRLCRYGKRGTPRVALIGNSHAASWFPAVNRVARANGWQVVTRIAAGCAPSLVRQKYGAATEACLDWVRRNVRGLVRSKPDLVVVVARLSAPAAGHTYAESGPLYRSGYRKVLRRLAEARIPVLVVHDNPNQRVDGRFQDGAVCLQQHPSNYAACDAEQVFSVKPDPAWQAAGDVDSPWVRRADLTAHFCQDGLCPAAAGGMTVYRDIGHLTRTYAKTLSPYLRGPMESTRALGR